MIPHTHKPVVLKKNQVSSSLEAELLREDVLDLLHPIQAVLDLQVNLGPLKMVPNDSPYPKTWGLKKIKFLAYSDAKLLHEDVLDLLQPVQAVLDLQVNLGPLKMVLNDSPCPKTYGLKKIKFLAYLDAKLLHEDVLDLVQSVHAILQLQVNLGTLKMVPKKAKPINSPRSKTLKVVRKTPINDKLMTIGNNIG